MRAVFQRAGWAFAGPVTELGREWALYRITSNDWVSRTALRTEFGGSSWLGSGTGGDEG